MSIGLRFVKGAPEGRHATLPEGRRGASVSEHTDKCLTVNRVDIF